MNISDWISTRISQISSLSKHDGGGENTNDIDSNEEFACLARLLANCETPEDRKFVNDKMIEYLNGAKKEHFENSDGTSYDTVFDNTGNRMYVGYDVKGNLARIDTTKIGESGSEVPVQQISINKDGSIFMQNKDE